MAEVVVQKPWYKSRMLWTNLGALVASIGIYFETGNLATSMFPAGLALVNILLRLVTKQPIG